MKNSNLFLPHWKEMLERLDTVLLELSQRTTQPETNLRFDLPALAVSSISGQYYCEKKVELGIIHGREKSPEMLAGKEAHENLLKDAVKLERERIWREIASGNPVGVREMPLIGKYNDVIVCGVSDAVYFLRGAPILLLEHKFSRYNRPFNEHHVQAGLYCLLLNIMGFNTENLRYALILAPSECRDEADLMNVVEDIFSRQNEDVLTKQIGDYTANIFLKDFDIQKSKQEIDWALGFWRNSREAVSTTVTGKCKVCEFGQICNQ
jgi:CRISPR/Cas system-associated exonuclease Cas4 (RecB family)